jgi:hypothetical protein
MVFSFPVRKSKPPVKEMAGVALWLRKLRTATGVTVRARAGNRKKCGAGAVTHVASRLTPQGSKAPVQSPFSSGTLRWL